MIIGIGRLTEQKAFDRLIRAHSVLQHKGFDHHLVILGDGAQKSFLFGEARRLGVENTVFMPGHVENVADWLARSTVFALCSRYEGLPLVLLEAIAQGIPTVAMDCPSGPREILQDGKYGLLVAEGDETAFTDALASLLKDPALRAKYAALGLERARHYAPERIANEWENFLMHVIERHQR